MLPYCPHRKAHIASLISSVFLVTACGGGGDNRTITALDAISTALAVASTDGKAQALARKTTAPAPAPAPAPVTSPTGTYKTLFSDNFDDEPAWGVLWNKSVDVGATHIPVIVPNSPNGNAVSMTLTAGDGRRNELSASYNVWLPFDNEYRITLQTKIAQYDFANAPVWATLIQFHSVPSLLPDGRHNWACQAGRNPMTITQQMGNLWVNVNSHPATQAPRGAIDDDGFLWHTPIVLNQWTSWVIRLKPSKTSAGIVQVWKDGVLVGSYFGQNSDLQDKCGGELVPFTYMKIGIYKDKNNTATQEAQFDNVKIEQLQ